MKHKLKLAILVLVAVIILGSGIYGAVRFFSARQKHHPLIYSNSAMLYELWNAYKSANLEPGSYRTIDHSQPGNITTSEGESYTMLRAVWQGDHTTFTKSLNFTLAYMQRPDHLFSWRYSQLPNGHYGINKTNGNYNTASDGDTQIALALLMAYSRWNEVYYLQVAQPIITNIWNKEVVQILNKPVITADNLERYSKTTVLFDPSYCYPAAYKVFAKIDPQHNWNALANNCYSLISKLASSKLGSSKSDGLPPNFIEINRLNGSFSVDNNPNYNTDYGYDAFRIPFNLALDYQWFHDPKDISTLRQFSYLETLWNKHHAINAVYKHSGAPAANYQSPAMYGASLGYFLLEHPNSAKQIYQQKLLPLYSPDKQSWTNPMSYYNDNWAWFGMALAQKALPNLTKAT